VARVQLALNVSDLDASIAFYSKLFDTEPAKRRTGYANFVIGEPALKLVLIESTERRATGPAGALNHLGVEVGSTDEVQTASTRLAAAGLSPVEESGTVCCYARQDKAWVADPDRTPWEVYTVLADVDTPTMVCDSEVCC
jgi:catechol 2,3-dioxygenase-like lactoylglutathione lyase family enzyme